MPEPNVFPYYIRTPRPAPEAVPPGRHDFYTWLAQKLLPRRQIRVEQPKYIYVTSEQMKSQPSAIWNLLDDPPSIQGRPSLAIVDLSTNPYHLMRNIFLQHVSSLSSSWIQGSPSRKVAILLPLLPPHSSLFWHPITSSKMNLERSNQLVVLGNDGTCRPNELEGDILLEYSRRQSFAGDDLIKMLDDRIVRKLGHFKLDSDEDPYCTEYYFETDAAEREIGELVIQWVEEHIRPRLQGKNFTLVSHGNPSESFHTAVAGAAATLNCRFVSLSGSASFLGEDIDNEVALVFNVIHTGQTFSDVVKRLRLNGVSLAHEALAIMSTDPGLNLDPGLPSLRPLCRRDRQKIARSACPQCRIMLPHSDPKNEAQIEIPHSICGASCHAAAGIPRGLDRVRTELF